MAASLLHNTLLYSSPVNWEDIKFSGLDLISYYISIVQNYFADYSWQVRTAYGIVVGCIFVMIIVFCCFVNDILTRRKTKRITAQIEERYTDAFRNILGNLTLTNTEMEEYLGATEQKMREVPAKYYVGLLAKVRMEMYEIVYLPNLQHLTDLIGVREHFEHNLLKGKDVFGTLQILLMFQLIISEGRLANYVNSNDTDIRMMARMCYILCSENEPYKYLLEDLDSPQSMIRPMLLHYIFGWMKEKERRMPSFLMTADRIKNEQMAAFLIREVAYWGNDDEKKLMSRYFMSERRECRSAAISVVGLIRAEDDEDRLIETYIQQPEDIRRDILRCVLGMKSGRQLDFLYNCYVESSSRETRELALSCIYNYSAEGRRKFEEIRSNCTSDEEHTLLDQIDSANLLVMIRSLQ